MERKGKLRVTSGVSRLENWRKLARRELGRELGAATDFLAERGLDDGDNIQITGTLGSLDDGTAVCFITAAALAPAALRKADAGGARTGKKRATKTKSAKNSGAKKSSVKKSGAKKASAGKKSAAGKKSGGKKSGGKKVAARRSSKKSPGK